MVLRMKNFNILGVHWKIQLSGEGSRKINIYGGLPIKGRLRRFVDLRGAWQERAGGVFEGGWYPNAHYDSGAKFEGKLIFCFKNDKNLVNFDLSTKKFKKFALWLVPFVQSIPRLT